MTDGRHLMTITAATQLQRSAKNCEVVLVQSVANHVSIDKCSERAGCPENNEADDDGDHRLQNVHLPT